MTEGQFQKARKIMASANHTRGLITAAKGNVAKWTAIEDCHRRNLKEAQADGAKKMINKSIERLAVLRKKFADLKFPEDVPDPEPNRCKDCGAKIAEGNNYCGECLCED